MFPGCNKAFITGSCRIQQHDAARIDEHGAQGRVHDASSDFIQMQQGAQGLADPANGILVIVFQAVEDPVDKLLNPVADRIEKKHHRQDKNKRKQGGPGHPQPSECQVGYQNKHPVYPGNRPRRQHIPVGALDDGIDGKEVVLDDGVADGKRKQAQEYGKPQGGVREKKNVPDDAPDQVAHRDKYTDKHAQKNRLGLKPDQDRGVP